MRRRLRRLLLIMLAGALAVVFAAATWGQGGRGFFSPDTLEARSQTEWLVPLVDLPVFRGRATMDRYPLVDYLIAQGYWHPRNSSEPVWIEMYQWNRQWYDGESFLYRQLCWRGDHWIQWTKENPGLAAALWPRLLLVLRSGTPDAHMRASRLLSLAMIGPTTRQFEKLADEDNPLSKQR